MEVLIDQLKRHKGIGLILSTAGLGAVVLGGVAYFKYYVETEQGGNE